MMDRDGIGGTAATAKHHAHEPSSIGTLVPAPFSRDVNRASRLQQRYGLLTPVVTLLEAALGQVHNQAHPALSTLLKAISLLRQQIDPPAARIVPNEKGHMLAWQARKVRDYIDSHITGPVLVADLCALVQRSEAHFSRSFKRTFGESPHSFVVRRRVELAAQLMLTTDASLSDIALRCGFADQAHLCKLFRQAAAQTPAAWRRAHRWRHDENGTPAVERFAIDTSTAAINDAPVRQPVQLPARASYPASKQPA